MPEALVQEFVIPKTVGRAFEVKSGQVFRVIAHEGKQVGDMTMLRMGDYREKFSSLLTMSLSGRSLFRAEKLYSGLPFGNVMLTVENDKYGMHWIGGRCTQIMYKEREGLDYHRSCHENIVEALKPYGISEYEVPLDTFNIFMVGELHEDGHYSFTRPPVIEKGDFIDFRAHLDTLVVISACPSADEINDNEPKALKVEIRQG